MRRLAGLALVVGALTAPTPAWGASPALAVTITAATVAPTRAVKITLKCYATKNCGGSVRLTVGGIPLKTVSYGVTARTGRVYTFILSASQYAKVPTNGSTKATVLIAETAPNRIAARNFTVALSREAVTPIPTPTPTPTPTATPTPTPTPTEPPVQDSRAYREKNWTPTARDTCSAALHASHSVIGPDGKRYPTWHAPTDTDPATGETCTYGHEHGDDPSTSDIYDWVTDFIDADATPNPGGWPRGGLTVVRFANSHLIYALTWFGLALMSGAGFVLFWREEKRRRAMR